MFTRSGGLVDEDDRGSLATAFQQVVQGSPGDLAPPEKQVVEQRVPSNTGALSRAQTRLPLVAVEAVFDQIFTNLMQPAGAAVAVVSDRRFLDALAAHRGIDEGLSARRQPAWGSALARYPDPGGASGLAVRPCWVQIYGSAAVIERGLTGQILERLPAAAALMADRNLAVFPVAWATQRHNLGVLFRVTAERARKIAGHCLPPAGRERRIAWRFIPHDRRAHPALPADGVVPGRFIAAHVEGEDGKRMKLGSPGNLWVALGRVADGPGLRIGMAVPPGRHRTKVLEGCHRQIKRTFGVVGGKGKCTGTTPHVNQRENLPRRSTAAKKTG